MEQNVSWSNPCAILRRKKAKLLHAGILSFFHETRPPGTDGRCQCFGIVSGGCARHFKSWSITRRPAWLPTATDTTPDAAMILASFAWTAGGFAVPLHCSMLCADAMVLHEVVQRDTVLIAGHGRAVAHRPSGRQEKGRGPCGDGAGGRRAVGRRDRSPVQRQFADAGTRGSAVPHPRPAIVTECCHQCERRR